MRAVIGVCLSALMAAVSAAQEAPSAAEPLAEARAVLAELAGRPGTALEDAIKLRPLYARFYQLEPRACLQAVAERMGDLEGRTAGIVHVRCQGLIGAMADGMPAAMNGPIIDAKAAAAEWAAWWEAHGETFVFPHTLVPQWIEELDAEIARRLVAVEDAGLRERLQLFHRRSVAYSGPDPQSLESVLSLMPRHTESVPILIGLIYRNDVPYTIPDPLRALSGVRPPYEYPPSRTSVRVWWRAWWIANRDTFEFVDRRDELWARATRAAEAGLAREPDAAHRTRLQSVLDGLLGDGRGWAGTRPLERDASVAAPPLLVMALLKTRYPGERVRLSRALTRISGTDAGHDPEGGWANLWAAADRWLDWWEASAEQLVQRAGAGPSAAELAAAAREQLELFAPLDEAFGRAGPGSGVADRAVRLDDIERLLFEAPGRAKHRLTQLGYPGLEELRPPPDYTPVEIVIGATPEAFGALLAANRRSERLSWGVMLWAYEWCRRGEAGRCRGELERADASEAHRLALEMALAVHGDGEAALRLAGRIGGPDPVAARAAVWLLGWVRDRTATPPAVAWLPEATVAEQVLICRALQRIGDPGCGEGVTAQLAAMAEPEPLAAALDALVAARVRVPPPQRERLISMLLKELADRPSEKIYEYHSILEQLDRFSGRNTWADLQQAWHQARFGAGRGAAKDAPESQDECAKRARTAYLKWAESRSSKGR